MEFDGTPIYKELPLEVIAPELFDRFLEGGWRALAERWVLHNSILMSGLPCWTVPLRIRLEHFEFTARQRKVFRRHLRHFEVKVAEIRLTQEKDQLFLKHCQRFVETRDYHGVTQLLSPFSAYLPVAGYEISVFDAGRLVACSYFHVGAETLNSTYCFFDPDYTNWSLGTFTLLFEIQIAQQLGKKFYYLGYAHSIPTQFDYKFNFHQLEALDWNLMRWIPRERKPVANWREEAGI